MEKNKVVEEERKAWNELNRRMDFFIELSCSSMNKGLSKDAGTAFNSAADDFFVAHDLRVAAELGTK